MLALKHSATACAQVYKPASGADIVFMRVYARGVLKKEAVLRVGQIDLRRKEVKGDRALQKQEKRAAAKVRARVPGMHAAERQRDYVQSVHLGIYCHAFWLLPDEHADGSKDKPRHLWGWHQPGGSPKEWPMTSLVCTLMPMTRLSGKEACVNVLPADCAHALLLIM